MTFQIGDKAFYATFSSSKQIWVECPECGGTGLVRVILATEKVSIACECCRSGYEGSLGKIKSYEPAAEVQSVCIEGIETQAQRNTRYRILHRGGIYIAEDDRIFTDNRDAESCAARLVEEHAKELKRRLGEKVKSHKNWAWTVSYHRGRIRQAEKDLVHHRAALAVTSKKAKSPPEEVT